MRVASYFGAESGDGKTALYAVLTSKVDGAAGILSTRVGASFTSLAERLPQRGASFVFVPLRRKRHHGHLHGRFAGLPRTRIIYRNGSP